MFGRQDVPHAAILASINKIPNKSNKKKKES
jgi:hypothetical protein